MTHRVLASAFAIAACAASLSAFSAARISPLQPSEFDLVDLRMTVDSCMFVPESVSVSAAANVIRVSHTQRSCLVAGEPQVVDIRLGSLPVGSWRVELYPNNEPDGQYTERIFFSVSGRPQIAVFPPPPRPLTDYSGMWFRAVESGWGLSFHQSPTNVVFGAWYVHDATGTPVWYTLQGGTWVTSTQWSGKIYRTPGPPLFAPVFDPALVVTTDVGAATLEFAQKPGEEGIATFSYTVNGQSGSKRITRLRF